MGESKNGRIKEGKKGRIEESKNQKNFGVKPSNYVALQNLVQH